MTGTDVARFTHKQSRSYLNHLVCSFPKFLNYKVVDNLRVHNLPKLVLMKLLVSPSVW